MQSGKKRILFVDDESNFLDALMRGLHIRCMQWETVFHRDAATALQEALEAPFDAIVTDVHMPGMDGFELLGALQQDERTRNVPVIVLTGAEDDGLKRRALEEGATDLLSKPIHMEDLLARLNSVLRLKAHQDELRILNAELEQRVEDRTQQLRQAHIDIVWRLAKAGEFRDDGTGDHVARVGCYCRAIAERLGMAKGFVESIFLTAPLHDIGKIGIADGILLKPDRLTSEEWRIMRNHCEIGAKILTEETAGMRPFFDWQGSAGHARATETNELLSMASSVARCHHERWDGTGYPQGIAGEDIPLEARIVSLTDVYDVLNSARPYKPAYSHEITMKIMRTEATSGHFDPLVYEAFEAGLNELLEIRREITSAAEIQTPGE